MQPSNETEAEALQRRQVEALERIAHLLEPIAVNAKAMQIAALRCESWTKSDTEDAIASLSRYQTPKRKS